MYHSKIKKGHTLMAIAFSCTFTALLPTILLAQASIDATTASQQLSSIYRAYDSMRYVSFDIRIVMDTDTLNGQSQHSEQLGRFSVAGKKYHYTLGGNEVMQNDSFLVSFYKLGRTVILDRPRAGGASSIIPGSRGAMDSILSSYSNSYNMFTDDTEDGHKLLLLHAKGAQMPYSDISMEYDPRRHYLLKSSYTFYGPVHAQADSIASSSAQTLRRHVLSVYYENYRFDPESFTSAFSEARFVRYDGKRYWPVQAYANYQFFNMISK